jgi:uncharacterized protein (DUF1330 family)
MPAYLISQTEEILDLEGLRLYVEAVMPIMARYGARSIVNSFSIERLDGEGPTPLAAGVVEFPDLENLRAFWTSKDHVPLLELRNRSVRTSLLIADVPPEE